MQLFTGIVGIFLVFVDLTGSLPVGTKPRFSSDVASGYSYFTQNNKVLYNNKIVPKLATTKVPSVASRTRKAGNNPYSQTFFRLRPEETVLDVVEPLVKPTDYQRKSVGDEKPTQLFTKKSGEVEKTVDPIPEKSVDDRKIIKPTPNKFLEKQTNEVLSNKEVDDGDKVILDQVSSKSKLCGNSSESSSSEEESSEESTTGNPLSQCNSSEEGSGDSLSEGSSNQSSSEENTSENSSGSEEGTTEYYSSDGEKLGDNYSEENAGEAKDNKYKTDEKSTSTGTTKADSSEENEGGVSESSGNGQEDKNSSEENLTTVNPSDEYATTDSSPSEEGTTTKSPTKVDATNDSNPDEDTTIKNHSGGDATTESNSPDEDTATNNPSQEINYSTTEISSSNENNYATTEASSLKGNNYVTTEIESTPTTEQPVFGLKLTEQPATENIDTTTVKQLTKSTGNKIEQKTYNDDDPTIFYLGSKKLIPYYLRRSNPVDNKSIQKTSTITSAGGTQQRFYSLTGKNRRNSIGKTPKITIGGTQQNYALSGRFPPRTG